MVSLSTLVKESETVAGVSSVKLWLLIAPKIGASSTAVIVWVAVAVAAENAVVPPLLETSAVLPAVPVV